MAMMRLYAFLCENDGCHGLETENCLRALTFFGISLGPLMPPNLVFILIVICLVGSRVTACVRS